MDPARVLAIHLEVDGGLLSDRVVSPVTCRQGKVEAIDQHIGCRPTLAVGDSMGDLEMLEYATQALIVGRTDQAGTEISALADARGWPIHRF